MKRTSPCPICGSPASKIYDHPEAEILRCASCSHCFSDQHSIVPETYADDYFINTHRNWFKNPNFELFKKLLELVRPYGDSASVLDVGCGRGDFLIYLQQKYPTLKLTGIDLAPLPTVPGIRLITSDIFDMALTEKFDVIVTLAVIEHVSDIRRFTDMLKQFGHPSSTIAIMTLNEDSLIYSVAKILKRVGIPSVFNRLYSKHHLNHYTLSSLRCLVESSGLNVVSQRTHNFPLAAVDFPSRGPVLDFVQLCGVALLFCLGRLTNKAFLQTIICRV
jgi:SAM-dependent methyltransferase